jgi:tRNA threonylcarbamoyl adenosine modification protein YeaZ
MKILGIDTSTKFLCLGLSDDRKIYEYNLEVERALSTLLSVTIKRSLDALGWKASDIDYFACGLGPGSFTGIRVGVAAIKGLSWVTHKPVIGVSSLDIIAGNARNPDQPVVTIIDAKRNLIYCGIYKIKNGALIRTAPYMLLTETEFLKKVPRNAIITGDALNLYKEKILRYVKGAKLLEKDYWYPKAHNIIELALDKVKEKKFSDSFKIKPIYLYPKECQIKIQK